MIAEAISYLTNQSWETLALLFWFTILFDLPRYTLGFLALAVRVCLHRSPKTLLADPAKVSVVVAGHNEAKSIAHLVASLEQQSRRPDEIVVVSDGSTDGMDRVIQRLEQEGRIDRAVILNHRGGKSAGSNLAARYATGDILINVDGDCSLERDALENLIKPFSDPKVGAVSGNIRVRNEKESLIATFQEIEYEISISLGKQMSDLFGQVVCVSGAFGAFRRTAYDQVGGMAPGPGEDFDLTMQLRKAGWRVRFAPDAVCATDVPATFSGYVKQRRRWERDIVRLRYRRHANTLDPTNGKFNLRELFHQAEFLVFHVIASVVFPFYLIWLFSLYGLFAFVVLLAIQLGLFVVDLVAILASKVIGAGPKLLAPFVFLPGYTLFQSYIARFIRLFSYAEEWFFFSSEHDTYVPKRVRLERKW